MNPPTNEHVDIAGYLMEMLTPEQKRRADQHLAGCVECHAEVESMREWADALRAVPEEMLLDGPPDDADLLLQRTLRHVRRESSARRFRRAAMVVSAAAAAIVVAVSGGVIVGRATAPAPIAQPSTAVTVPGTRTVAAVNPDTGASMQVTVVPAQGWIRVRATVGGVPAGEQCRLEVVGRDGSSMLAGSWLVSPAGETSGTTIDGSALIAPTQVASIRVRDADGKVYVSADV